MAMDFLSTLHTDVRLLLLGSALALLAGLFSGTKKNEQRYLVLFTVLMVIAGLRFHYESRPDTANQTLRSSTTGNPARIGSPR